MAVKKLARFTIDETEEGYLLHIEDADGGKMDLEAAPEQIDAIIDALDDLLTEDEEAVFAVAEDDDADRPATRN